MITRLLIFLLLGFCLGANAIGPPPPWKLTDLIQAFESDGMQKAEELILRSPQMILAQINATPFAEQRELARAHPEAWAYLTFRVLQLASVPIPTPTARGTIDDTWSEILRAESLRNTSQADLRVFLQELGLPPVARSGKLGLAETQVRAGNWFNAKTVPIVWETIFHRLHVLRANGCLQDSSTLLTQEGCVSILRQLYGALTEGWLVRPRENFIPGAAIRVGGRQHADGWQVSFTTSDANELLLTIESLIEIKPSVVAFHHKGMYQIHGFLRRLLDPGAEISIYGHSLPRHLVRVRTKAGLLSLNDLRAKIDADLLADGEADFREFESPAIAYDGRWGAFVDLFARTFRPEFYEVVLPSDEVDPIARHLRDLPNQPAGTQTRGELTLRENRDWSVQFLLRHLPVADLTEDKIWNALFAKENSQRSVIVRVLLDRPESRISPSTPIEKTTLDPRFPAKDYAGMLAEATSHDTGYRRLLNADQAEKYAFLRDVFFPYAGWRGMMFAPGKWRPISVSHNRLKIEGTIHFRPIAFEWVDPETLNHEPRWEANGGGYLLRIPRGYVWPPGEEKYVAFDRGLLGHDLKRYFDDEEVVEQRKAFGEWNLHLKDGQSRILTDFETELDAKPGQATGIYVLGPVGYGKNTLMVRALRSRMRRLSAAPTRNVFLAVTRYRASMDRTSRGLRRYPEIGTPLNFEHLSWESDGDRRRVGNLRQLIDEARRRNATGTSIVLTSTWDYLARAVAGSSPDQVRSFREVLGGVFVDEADQIGIDQNRTALEKIVDNNPVTFWAQEDHPTRGDIVDRFCHGNLQSVYEVPDPRNHTLEALVGRHMEIGIERGDLTPLAVDGRGDQVITHFTPEEIMRGFAPKDPAGASVPFNARDIYAPIASDSLRRSAFLHLVKKLEPTLRRNRGFLQGMRSADQAEQMAHEFQSYFDEIHRQNPNLRRMRIVALHADTSGVDEILRRLDGQDPRNPIDWVITPQMFNLRRFLPNLSAAILFGEEKDPRLFYDLVGQLMEPSLDKRFVEVVQVSKELSLNSQLIAQLGAKRRALEARAATPATPRARRAPAAPSTVGTTPETESVGPEVAAEIFGPPTLDELKKVEATHEWHRYAFFDPDTEKLPEGEARESALRSLFRRFAVETSSSRGEMLKQRCSTFGTQTEQLRCFDAFWALRQANLSLVVRGLARLVHPSLVKSGLQQLIDLRLVESGEETTLAIRMDWFNERNNWLKSCLLAEFPALDSLHYKLELHPVLPNDVGDVPDLERRFFENFLGVFPPGIVDSVNANLSRTPFAKDLKFEPREFWRLLGPELTTSFDSQVRLVDPLDHTVAVASHTPAAMSAAKRAWPIDEAEVAKRLGPAEAGEKRSELDRMQGAMGDLVYELIAFDTNLPNYFIRRIPADITPWRQRIIALIMQCHRIFPDDAYFAAMADNVGSILSDDTKWMLNAKEIVRTVFDYHLAVYASIFPQVTKLALRMQSMLSDLPIETTLERIDKGRRQVEEAKAIYLANPSAAILENDHATYLQIKGLFGLPLPLSPELYDRAIAYLDESREVMLRAQRIEWVEGRQLIRLGRIDGTKLVRETAPPHALSRGDLSELTGQEREIAVAEVWSALAFELSIERSASLLGRMNNDNAREIVQAFSRIHTARLMEINRGLEQIFGENRIAPLLSRYLLQSQLPGWPLLDNKRAFGWVRDLPGRQTSLMNAMAARVPTQTLEPVNLRVIPEPKTNPEATDLTALLGFTLPPDSNSQAYLRQSTIPGKVEQFLGEYFQLLGEDARPYRHRVKLPDNLGERLAVISRDHIIRSQEAAVGTRPDLEARVRQVAQMMNEPVNEGKLDDETIRRVFKSLVRELHYLEIDFNRHLDMRELNSGRNTNQFLLQIINRWRTLVGEYQKYFPKDVYIDAFGRLAAMLSIKIQNELDDDLGLLASALAAWPEEFRAYIRDVYPFADVRMEAESPMRDLMIDFEDAKTFRPAIERAQRGLRSLARASSTDREILDRLVEAKLPKISRDFVISVVGEKSSRADKHAAVIILLKRLQEWFDTYHRPEPLPRNFITFNASTSLNVAGFVAESEESTSQTIDLGLSQIRQAFHPSQVEKQATYGADDVGALIDKAEMHAARLSEILGEKNNLTFELRALAEKFRKLTVPASGVEAAKVADTLISRLIARVPVLTTLSLFTGKSPTSPEVIPDREMIRLKSEVYNEPAPPLRITTVRAKELVDHLVKTNVALRAILRPLTEAHAQENLYRILQRIAFRAAKETVPERRFRVAVPDFWNLGEIIDDPYVVEITNLLVLNDSRNPLPQAMRPKVFDLSLDIVRTRYPELGLPIIDSDGNSVTTSVDFNRLFADPPSTAFSESPAPLTIAEEREIHEKLAEDFVKLFGPAAEAEIDGEKFDGDRFFSEFTSNIADFSEAYLHLLGPNEVSKWLLRMIRDKASLQNQFNADPDKRRAAKLLVQMIQRCVEQLAPQYASLFNGVRPFGLLESLYATRADLRGQILSLWTTDPKEAADRAKPAALVLNFAIREGAEDREVADLVLNELSRRTAAFSLRFSRLSKEDPVALRNEFERLLAAARTLFPADRFLPDYILSNQVIDGTPSETTLSRYSGFILRIKQYLEPLSTPDYNFDLRLTGDAALVGKAPNEMSQWIGDIRRILRGYRPTGNAENLIEKLRAHQAAKNFDFSKFPADEAEIIARVESIVAAYRDELIKFKRGQPVDYDQLLQCANAVSAASEDDGVSEALLKNRADSGPK